MFPLCRCGYQLLEHHGPWRPQDIALLEHGFENVRMIRMCQGRRGGRRGGGRGTGGRERVMEHEMHVINKMCNSRWTSDHQGHEHDSQALALALIRVRLF